MSKNIFSAWANVIMHSVNAKPAAKLPISTSTLAPAATRMAPHRRHLLVLEKAIAHPKMSQMLVAHFNDVDKNLTDTLQNEINKLPGVEKLKYKPQVPAAKSMKMPRNFSQKLDLVPSFTFIDPFGYKGLSLRIVKGVIKDWGCDCVFFFNYNRINAGLTNDAVKQHIDALFGEDRAEEMRVAVKDKTPAMREAFILEQLARAD